MKPSFVTYTIGSDSNSNIRLMSEDILPIHAYLYYKDECYYIRKATNNATLDIIEGPDLNTKKAIPVHLETQIKIGRWCTTIEFLLDQIQQIQTASIKLSETKRRVPHTELLAKPNFYSPSLEFEILFSKQNGIWYLSFLSSETVTIQGRTLTPDTKIKSFDQMAIKIGHHLFGYNQDQHEIIYFGHYNNINLTIKNATYTIKQNKVLTNNISTFIKAGNLVALMGVSGSGKSTLLKLCTGILKPNLGAIFYNGLALHSNYDFLSDFIGYMPQTSTIHEELSVQEAIKYSLLIRTNAKHLENEICEITTKVLSKLNLHESNRNILSTQIKNLSGGQRKLLDLAVELLSDPQIIFLDEPLSGLSSEDANLIIKRLRDLADQGKTIIVTIHQPSSHIYHQFDQAIYLKEGGNLVYSGPISPDSFHFFKNKDNTTSSNPEKILEFIQTTPTQLLQKKYQASPYNNFNSIRNNILPHFNAKQKAIDFAVFSGETAAMSFRCIIRKIKDKINTATLIAQAPIIAVLIALVFSHSTTDDLLKDIPIICFLCVIASAWFGASNTVRDICGEWHIFNRERLAGIMIISYIFSKMNVATFIGFIQTLILATIITASTDIQINFFHFLSILWLTNMTGAILGLFISAIASGLRNSNEIAIGLIPVFLLPMFILAGYIQPVKEMSKPMIKLSNLAFTRWSFEAVMFNEAPKHEGTISIPGISKTEYLEKKTAIIKPFFQTEEASYKRVGFTKLLLNFLWILSLALTTLYYKDPKP